MKLKKIKFGTDGWRAIIARDYTVDNVCRVSIATANWLNQKCGIYFFNRVSNLKRC